MAGQHALDLVSRVGSENFRVAVQRHAFAPFDLDDLDLVAEALRHVDPKMAELAEARGKYLVAR